MHASGSYLRRTNSEQNLARQQRLLHRKSKANENEAEQLGEYANQLQQLEDELNREHQIIRAEQERLRQMATDATPARGPNLSIPEFHGHNKENIDQWLKQFELLFKVTGWTDSLKPQVLAAKLRGRAFMAYDSLWDSVKCDYSRLVGELKRTFTTSDRTRYLHQQYETRCQAPNESVSDYGCALYELGLAALNELDESHRDSLIRIKFMGGLLPHLRQLVNNVG